MPNVPARPVLRSPSALVDALNREWATLRDADPAATADLDAWMNAARRGDDAVLHELVGRTLAGDQLAGRAVLQSQLGRLVRLARRDPRAPVDDYVSAFWCVLARYPLDRRPVRIAANLALDSLKLVHRDRRWMGRRAVVVQHAGEALELAVDRATRPVGEPEAEASEVIRAGERLRLIDPPTSRLLHAVYVEGLSGKDAALRCATTPGSLRVRCSRAVQRLAEHASDLAEAA